MVLPNSILELIFGALEVSKVLMCCRRVCKTWSLLRVHWTQVKVRKKKQLYKYFKAAHLDSLRRLELYEECVNCKLDFSLLSNVRTVTLILTRPESTPRLDALFELPRPFHLTIVAHQTAEEDETRTMCTMCLEIKSPPRLRSLIFRELDLKPCPTLFQSAYLESVEFKGCLHIDESHIAAICKNGSIKKFSWRRSLYQGEGTATVLAFISHSRQFNKLWHKLDLRTNELLDSEEHAIDSFLQEEQGRFVFGLHELAMDVPASAGLLRLLNPALLHTLLLQDIHSKSGWSAISQITSLRILEIGFVDTDILAGPFHYRSPSGNHVLEQLTSLPRLQKFLLGDIPGLWADDLFRFCCGLPSLRQVVYTYSVHAIPPGTDRQVYLADNVYLDDKHLAHLSQFFPKLRIRGSSIKCYCRTCYY
jgi:hypothetical protein